MELRKFISHSMYVYGTFVPPVAFGHESNQIMQHMITWHFHILISFNFARVLKGLSLALVTIISFFICSFCFVRTPIWEPLLLKIESCITGFYNDAVITDTVGFIKNISCGDAVNLLSCLLLKNFVKIIRFFTLVSQYPFICSKTYYGSMHISARTRCAGTKTCGPLLSD